MTPDAPGAPPARAGRPHEAKEQTTLAWERTALLLLAVAAATARHTWSVLGVTALVPLALLALLSLWVLAEGWRRYDDDRASPRYRPIAGPTMVLSLTAAGVAAMEMSYLVLR